MHDAILIRATGVDIAAESSGLRLRILTDDGLGPFDVPLRASHASALGQALLEMAS